MELALRLVCQNTLAYDTASVLNGSYECGLLGQPQSCCCLVSEKQLRDESPVPDVSYKVRRRLIVSFPSEHGDPGS